MFNRKTKKLIQLRQDVFIQIYENLCELWKDTAELYKCRYQIDVSQFDEPVDEWVRIINNHFHVYNGVQYKVKAFKSTSSTFLGRKEFLNVELIDVPVIFNSTLKA